jgi:signal transduction histidine kinase
LQFLLPEYPALLESGMATQIDPTSEMVMHFQQLAEHGKAVLARELHDELGGLLLGAIMDVAL